MTTWLQRRWQAFLDSFDVDELTHVSSSVVLGAGSIGGACLMFAAVGYVPALARMSQFSTPGLCIALMLAGGACTFAGGRLRYRGVMGGLMALFDNVLYSTAGALAAVTMESGFAVGAAAVQGLVLTGFITQLYSLSLLLGLGITVPPMGLMLVFRPSSAVALILVCSCLTALLLMYQTGKRKEIARAARDPQDAFKERMTGLRVAPPAPGDDGTLSLPPNARVGMLVAGKYRIERVLGRGGMGVVAAAHHLGLRQTVAIKLLLPWARGRPNFATRLVREARAAAALKSEHVVRVFDADVLDDGSPFIVMEYLEGQTLAALLTANGTIEQAQAVEYALQICEALAEAHALGIVHRDLKPANLHLARAPGGGYKLRVLDFGISKALDVDWRDSAVAETDSHAFVGSPPYVSPEQLLDPGEVDARTDIWSLGIVLYECLSGKPPFRGETLARLWDSILRDEPPPISRDGHAVTPGLERIVQRCLEKKPARRHATVSELARELVEFAPRHARSYLEAIEARGAK